MIEMSVVTRMQAINLFAKIVKLKPKNATGVYITSKGVSWAYRTNPRKFPENFILLWPKEGIEK
ncbi:hypothetical protein LCGC14_2998960 [marine sediment metagenome]|uniref:Uncharacterized protein n=1 Tax=marine sediment metagenome TaxID=412755 RepID=A0A0F8X1M1_9ZZZZ